MHVTGLEPLHKPRILCLHGGGVSARIFRLQARQLIQTLAPYFRLVFADGPFPSEMHPDLTPVYSNMGPCFSWADLSSHCSILGNAPDANSITEKIRESLLQAMETDTGTGNWVGLLGFSQGAKLAVSILLEDQIRRQNSGSKTPTRGFLGADWKFGVLLAGRGPPYSLSHRTMHRPHFEHPGPITGSMALIESLTVDLLWDPPEAHDVLVTPTLHVHGLLDPGLPFHRLLLRYYVTPESAFLVEWEGQHRVPIRTIDVDAVSREILRMAKDTWAI